jgi:hypothetical protein
MVRHWFNNNCASLGRPLREVSSRSADSAFGGAVFDATSALDDELFKRMMGDKAVSVPLVNAVLQYFKACHGLDAIKDLKPAQTDISFGKRKRLRMDVHLQADDGRHVLVEMQVEPEKYFPKRAAFYALYTYLHQFFPRSESGDERSPGQPWSSRIKDVYAIQFLAASPGQRSEEVCATCWRLPDQPSDYRIGGIYMISIPLSGVTRNPDVVRRHSLLWTPFDWWCYLVKFSSEFDLELAGEFLDLSFPNGIRAALERLRLIVWSKPAKCDYRAPGLPAVIDAEVGATATREVDPELKTLLSRTTDLFCENLDLEKQLRQFCWKTVPENWLRQIWEEHNHGTAEETNQDPSRTDGQYDRLLARLREIGLMIAA